MARRHYINVEEKATGLSYRVDILDSNFSGSDAEIVCLERSPFTVNQRTFETDNRVWAYSKKIKVVFYVQDATEEAAYDYLFESEYKDVTVDVYYNGNIDFRGYLKPQESVKDYVDYPKQISFVASDGIDELKHVPVVDDDSNDIAEFEDISPKDVMSVILQELGLDLPIWIMNNTYETTYMTSTEQLLEESEVVNIRYQREVDGEVGWVDGLTGIETTLLTFNCALKQSAGKWWIINNRESNGPVHKYQYDGTFIIRETENIEQSLTDLCALDNGTVTFDQPLERIRILTRNSSYLGNANPNPHFNSGSASWTASSDWFTASFTQSTARLIDILGYSSANSYDLTSDQFLVQANGSFTLNFRIRWNLKFMSGHPNMNPTMEIQYNVNGGAFVQVGSSFVLNEYAFDNWNDSIITVETTQPSNFQMQVRARFYDNTGSQNWDELEVWFDEIAVIPNYADQFAFDEVRIVKVNNSKATKILEFEQYFSGDVPLNTIAGLLIKGNDGPFTFTRYGLSESLGLDVILGLDTLNDYRRFMRILTLNAVADDHFDSHMIISHDSKKWRILAYGYDPYNGTLNLTIREMDYSSDVPYTTFNTVLSTIDGYDYSF